jgi:hypothetical protein
LGLAVRAVALKLLGDRVSAASARVKADLAAELTVGDRKTAALTDGTAVGSVTYAKGRVTARVVNPNALADWVADNFPDEVQPQVRPAFLTAILDASKRAGQPMTPDGTLDVPGVVVGASEPYLTVRPDPAATDALVEAVRANGLLALETDPS